MSAQKRGAETKGKGSNKHKRVDSADCCVDEDKESLNVIEDDSGKALVVCDILILNHHLPQRSQGDVEIEEYDGTELDLKNKCISCEKNPDHAEFIPIDEFKLQHLPPTHRDKNLYKLIKSMADLTVRIHVGKVSPYRPMFWPDSDRIYKPPKEDRGKEFTGSGRIVRIEQFKNGVNEEDGGRESDYTKCWCSKCQIPPSNVWWECSVDTATHNVFDGVEAAHTSLRLFFDRESCDKVIIEKVYLIYNRIDDDKCWLQFATCDQSLGNRLENMINRYITIQKKVYEKYKPNRDTDKLTFIVSHPHGCPKKVSIGHWMTREKRDEHDSTVFTYSACTCPGSSGANVHFPGYSGFPEFVHIGVNGLGFNTCGANIADY
ncbi:uncharacterized protein LOC106059586 isoform X2 [Biomphalaria glabrata]|uniref:Uncharacterized protein LOC106059586 isoform X2 n=1 Tax=Biomphalaria glabrata TaxID=6526 RepID=A0A9W3BBV2_BIOGL|nr:uncharacterized protein LOC106059586 isoform X2 [Biomphalaria glabrata]